MKMPTFSSVAVIAFLMVMAGCSPSTQVTNKSGVLLNKVKVNTVEFTENLDHCGDGCSTGFINVPAGKNVVSLKVAAGSEWMVLGELGPFEKNAHYSVTVTKSGDTFCAELWKRLQTSTTFNDDATKIFVGKSCQP
jgi:hypothetical protein